MEMKKSTWDIILMALVAISAIACLVVLILCINSIIANGATSMRVWSIVLLSITFIICVAVCGVMYTLYKTDRTREALTKEEN